MKIRVSYKEEANMLVTPVGTPNPISSAEECSNIASLPRIKWHTELSGYVTNPTQQFNTKRTDVAMLKPRRQETSLVPLAGCILHRRARRQVIQNKLVSFTLGPESGALASRHNYLILLLCFRSRSDPV
jgi:hypothetical protein